MVLSSMFKINFFYAIWHFKIQNIQNLYSVLVKLLCGLEASQGPVQEVLSSAVGVSNAARESSDELDSEEGDEIKGSRKKKNKRRKGIWRVIGLVSVLMQRCRAC